MQALEKLSFDEVVHIHEQMRNTTSTEWFIDWNRLSLDNFFAREMSEDELKAVTIFSSFSPNGFIRERAVRRMKTFGGTLPFAVLRQNDWVQQVRDAAKETIDFRLHNLARGELVSALPFLDKLKRSGRGQANKRLTVISQIYKALTSSENVSELVPGLNAASIRTRRICINALFRSDNPRYYLAIERLRQEKDPLLRSNSFKRLTASVQDLDDVTQTFLADKYPLNRVLAFKYLCTKDLVKALKTAEELLLDKNSMVRENARDFLDRERPDFDFLTFYLDHLDENTAAAVYGVGESGASSNANIVKDYLYSEKISVVRAAMTSVMKLDSENYGALITEFLTDDRVGIVKTARNLMRNADLVNYRRIMEIFSGYAL